MKKESSNAYGFDVEKDKVDMFLYLKKEKPDLVIGATGSSLFNKEDLDQLEGEHVYHFISVSSSDREFPVSSFRKNTQIHCDVLNRNFVFVNNGSTLSLYVDGVFVGNSSAHKSWSGSLGSWTIGGWASSYYGDYTLENHRFSKFTVWDSALDSSKVSLIYQVGA